MSVSIPTEQIIYNTRIYQRENSKDMEEARFYLTKFINNLLKAFTYRGTHYSNKIIGCDPFFVDLVDQKIFRVVVSPGMLIVDSVLIEFPSPIFLDIDITNFKDYDEVVVITSYKFIQNKNKSTFQLLLRNSKTSQITSNSNLIIDRNEPFLILSRFKLIRENDKVQYVEHPYGRWITSFYSDFLKNISPLAIPINNSIYQILDSNVSLNNSFLINNIEQKMTVPLFLDYIFENDRTLFLELYEHYLNKTYQRYKIPGIFNFYYNKFDRNIQYRTEMFNDEYSYSI